MRPILTAFRFPGGVGVAHAFSLARNRTGPKAEEEDDVSVTTERVASIVAPVAERLGVSVWDIDQPGGTLRVMLDRDGGVDIDTLAEATREISRALDASDPIPGSYTLEVSSPGLERPLRTAEHFASVVGERIKVKLLPGAEGSRRADGILRSVEGDVVTVATDEGDRVVRLGDVTKAHTVFEFTAPAKPGSRSTRPPARNDSSEEPA